MYQDKLNLMHFTEKNMNILDRPPERFKLLKKHTKIKKFECFEGLKKVFILHCNFKKQTQMIEYVIQAVSSHNYRLYNSENIHL